VILFDSAARVAANKSRRLALASSARGSLSAALAGATRAAVRGAGAVDSVELVSHFTAQRRRRSTDATAGSARVGRGGVPCTCRFAPRKQNP
jgi:hypothetical protein